MEITSAVLTLLIPLLAYTLYCCHHLQLQLAECVTGECREPHSHEPQQKLSTTERKSRLLNQGSRVFCQGSSNVDRTCLFYNLCYHPAHKNFVFLHSMLSVYEGVPKDRQQPSLVDLSSIPNHNTQYFDYVDVPSSLLESAGNLTYLEGQYLLFNRFNPGNLMHVFHDDLLPVFYSLLQLGYIHSDSGSVSATLLINDRNKEGEYFHLYRHFSQNKPILTRHLTSRKSDLLCFEKVHIGLSKQTTWYQYGFQEPQGPLDDIKVTSKEITLFTSFLKSKLNIADCASKKSTDNRDRFVLLSRRTNRLILNEVELSLTLAQHFDAYIVVASLETHTLREIIDLISCSTGLIGVHGSLLSLSVFLPPNSFLVEIFPYAINPDNYTPYKTLSMLKGRRLVYRPWRNDNRDNTVAYPDAERELGGIAHMDPELQDDILGSTEVPPHLCCSDPHWLFRIYQDTIVDVGTFVRVVESALVDLQALQKTEDDLSMVDFQPGPVRDATCLSTVTDRGNEIGLLLSWKPPWNLAHFPPDSASNSEYEVSIQEQGEGALYAGAFVLPVTSHLFTEGFKKGRTYYVWIRCRAGSKTGPYVAITSCPYAKA